MPAFAVDNESRCPECRALSAIARVDQGMGADVFCMMTACNYRSSIAYDVRVLTIREIAEGKVEDYDRDKRKAE